METESTSLSSFPRRRESHRNSTKFAGFTLVELIVVITILVILGTIAFLNLGNFSGGARDSSRISDLANVSQGLDLWYVKNGTVPTPDASMVTITASGVTIGYQWYAGSSVLTRIKMGEAKDPLDKKYYTYLVTSDATRYQLLALLEDSTTTTSFVPNTYADYSARYPTTKGSSLGVLLGNTGTTLNQPVQEVLTGSFELTASTGGLYQAYVSKTQVIPGIGSALGGLAGQLTVKSAGSTYPGCDTRDIALPNGQVWAACNVGATSAYAGQGITNCGGGATDCNASLRYTLGSYFQWGRNEDVTSIASWSTTAPTGTLASAILGQFVVGADWVATQNDNLWGGYWTTSTWGTFASLGAPSVMQWPCASGYHIPTILEWSNAAQSINPAIANATNWIVNWQNDQSITATLKLPLSWHRIGGSGGYNNGWSMARYWSSSATDIYGAAPNFTPTQTVVYGNLARTHGMPIRCLKN